MSRYGISFPSRWARLNQATLRTLAYVGSLGQPALALHISPERVEAERFRTQSATRAGVHID